jgi:hypothetical protein
MLNLITGLVVDIFFGRSIAKAGNALAKDPEYNKTVKELEAIEKRLKALSIDYNKAEKAEDNTYFIYYGIDLSELDDASKYHEMQLIKRKLGKYKNLKPLDKKQQELNRQLLEKRDRIETEAMESQKIAMIKAHLKSEQKSKIRNIIISLIVTFFGIYLLFKHYLFWGFALEAVGLFFFWKNSTAIKTELKNKY